MNEPGTAHILVADDEESIRFVLREALAAAGHRVQCVEDGDAAFEAMASERFDLVLPVETLAMGAAQRLLETAASASFRRELDAIGGYETPDTGRVIADLTGRAG